MLRKLWQLSAAVQMAMMLVRCKLRCGFDDYTAADIATFREMNVSDDEEGHNNVPPI